MTPLACVLLVAAAISVVVWSLSVLTRDYSWVDRLWSVLPVAYVWIFAASTGLTDARLTLMAVLVTLWGVRLTFNFGRKGGYTGTEDYRWAILRGRMPRWAFALLNLFFITLFQNAVLVLITLPAYTAWLHRSPVGAADAVVAGLFLALLAGETVADEEQWRFQRQKAARHGAPPRFLQTGLWARSRHPNFFFEQAQWWVFFAFGALAAGSVWQWTVVGPLLLNLLFVGSTAFTESITRGRYPEYAAYQATTSPLVPWPKRRAGTSETTGAGR